MQEQIFRNYDIRGIYPTEIDEDCAYIVGHYFGELCNGKSILIGFDGRNSTPILFDALVQGIIDAGGKPISLGLVPSPVLYFGNNILKTAASIMITASHNPKEYNGFKMMLNGESFFGPNILKLKEICA
ncbi:MAG UNVERIFIED_CONTAM: hypothetical protein LVQ98_01155 [Rickettsiaceae bacterium]